MEDKIEVGEYVRTTNKGIGQIVWIDKDESVDEYVYFYAKHSENQDLRHYKKG